MGPALSCHRKQMKLPESFPGNDLKFIYQNREPEPRMHHPHCTHGTSVLAHEPKVSNLQCWYLFSKNLGENYEEEEDRVADWGFAVEHNKLRHREQMFSSLQEV